MPAKKCPGLLFGVAIAFIPIALNFGTVGLTACTNGFFLPAPLLAGKSNSCILRFTSFVGKIYSTSKARFHPPHNPLILHFLHQLFLGVLEKGSHTQWEQQSSLRRIGGREQRFVKELFLEAKRIFVLQLDPAKGLL